MKKVEKMPNYTQNSRRKLWKKKIFLNNINGIYTRNYKEGYVGYYFQCTNSPKYL